MDVENVCLKSKTASLDFVACTTDLKNGLLKAIKDEILSNVDKLKEINKIDLNNAVKTNYNPAFIDRLTLTDSRIKVMCDGIDDVINLPDYVGYVEDEYTLKNGLNVKKVHAPLGVIGIIYESRPNVTIDASILCIKSGNGVVLKGGKEAINTNRYLVSLIKDAFIKSNLNPDLVGFIDSVDREDTQKLLHTSKYVDVIIPRGGEKLKKFVLAEATMPVIASSGGNCHVYVDETANLDMALKVLINAKTQRPSVCNAAETLLCNRNIAKEFLPNCLEKLSELNVEIRGDENIKDYYDNVNVINDDEFYTEYEDMIIKVRVVDSIQQAIDHINKYGTHHSEAIITSNDLNKELFSTKVDAACVYVNASTRFTDGFELGLGAEMGISTQKLHVRGPIGLKELTSVKYVINGNGQIRG